MTELRRNLLPKLSQQVSENNYIIIAWNLETIRLLKEGTKSIVIHVFCETFPRIFMLIDR